MPIHRLNHAVLYVRNVERTVTFYRDVLGFRAIMTGPGVCFLQAPGSTNDHDLGVFEVGMDAAPSGAGRGRVGMYHLAWEVDTLADLAGIQDRLLEAGALVGASDHSTSKSLYGQDPDGLEFEVEWMVPADRMDAAVQAGRSQIRPLDLPREIARYGATTPGGIGISRIASTV